MTETLTLLLAAAAVVAAMLAVLVPVVLLQGKSLRREITLLSDRVDANATALAEVRAGARADLTTAVTDLRADLKAAVAEARAGARADLTAAVSDLRADLTDLRHELTSRMDALTSRVDALTVRMDSVAERVARIEGALTGPWRPPANGNPAPAAPSGTEPTP